MDKEIIDNDRIKATRKTIRKERVVFKKYNLKCFSNIEIREAQNKKEILFLEYLSEHGIRFSFFINIKHVAFNVNLDGATECSFNSKDIIGFPEEDLKFKKEKIKIFM